MNFIYNIISIIIGAAITYLSSYTLAKKQLKYNKSKIKFEQNLNTLRKLKVNHLTLVKLINDFYKVNHFGTTNEPNLPNKLYNTSLENIKLNNELLDVEINNISDLHSDICSFLYNLSSKTKNENVTIQALQNSSTTITKNILETIKNIDK